MRLGVQLIGEKLSHSCQANLCQAVHSSVTMKMIGLQIRL